MIHPPSCPHPAHLADVAACAPLPHGQGAFLGVSELQGPPLWLTTGPALLAPEGWSGAQAPSAVISLHEHDEGLPAWVAARLERGEPTLRLHLSDVHEPLPPEEPAAKDFPAPTPELLERAVTWGAQTRGWLHVHCAAGVSRSSAVVLGVICELMPHLSTDRVLEVLHQANPHARPNPWLLGLLDARTGRSLRLHPHWRRGLSEDELDRMFG